MEKKQRVLLVDDSKETLEGLKSYLERNYMVRTAANGLDAIKFFEKDMVFDLVITDMVMPEISGQALIPMIRAKSPGTPIIAMTCWGQFHIELATEAKAETVLEKPFEMEDLDRSISMLLLPRQ